MENNVLPTSDLKKYGIINEDDTFSKRLTPTDIQRFLTGAVIVADNDTKRITFQLVDNGSRLDVHLFEREKQLSTALQESKTKVSYLNMQESNPDNRNPLNFTKSAFIYDQSTGKVKELDMIQEARELTSTILETKDSKTIGSYSLELQKMEEYLQHKIEKFPEIAKDIAQNLNVISTELSAVNVASKAMGISTEKKNSTTVGFDVNDPDLYQDANRHRAEGFQNNNQSKELNNDQEKHQSNPRRR